MSTPADNVDSNGRKINPSRGIGAQKKASQHLSNERTYLSYIRTAIALIGFAVTTNGFSMFLVQSNLISQNESMRWELVEVERAGIGMVICGMILVIWTALQYRRVRRQIDRGDFRPDSRIIWTIAFVIVVGGGLSLLWPFPR